MSEAHFSVDPRLTRLLGETYRSSEVALKELVDNAWDADAQNVWITLPEPLTGDAVVIRDDGTGMTPNEMRREYLNIASDKRTRTGDMTPGLRRKIKGRKGIGKFAGLTLATQMQIEAVARGTKCTLVIDKLLLIENQGDLENVPLPLGEEPAPADAHGTTVTLSMLDQRLNFPTPERLKEVLVYEYGREENFTVHVNSDALSVEDVPGTTTKATAQLTDEGAIDLRFTIAEGKKMPRAPGIVLKVNGKAVGKPQFFDLDEDEEIPKSLIKRVYGEVELTGIEDFVTADWGGVIENSISYQEAKAYVQEEVKKALHGEHARDMSLQKARLQRQIHLRLQELPENRRHYAEVALNRILKRFYGESDERVTVIADVALDAMEHDAYWAVLEKIQACSDGDVSDFAASLEQFGLLELSTIGTQAGRRREFLDAFDHLTQNPKTLEKEAHQALETNLWVLGRQYALMSSNVTLKSMIASYCSDRFKGEGSAHRPDLLLSQGYGDRYLLIEFKRPSHIITRADVAQAEQYRDELTSRLSSTAAMDIMLIGRGKADTLSANNLNRDIVIHSYASVISAARSELDWIVNSLAA